MKTFIVALLVLCAGAAAAQSQPTKAPVPILKKGGNPTVSGLPQSAPVTEFRPAGAASMAGATRCEQSGTVITCDNGYRTVVK